MFKKVKSFFKKKFEKISGGGVKRLYYVYTCLIFHTFLKNRPPLYFLGGGFNVFIIPAGDFEGFFFGLRGNPSDRPKKQKDPKNHEPKCAPKIKKAF